MRFRIIVLLTLVLAAASTPAPAQVSIGIGLPGVSIGINVPTYPELVPVPGYPVYYSPQLSSNYFFYDGMYWVYQGDNWYASSWYNGPWSLVDPEFVPLFLLRVPVSYYREPPAYFRGWQRDAPPRWGEHWGGNWQQRRSGWDTWDRRSAPAAAPLPSYQRQYSGNRYPAAAPQQAALQAQNYHHQPSDPVVRQHFEQQKAQAASAPKAQASSAPAERPAQGQAQPRSPRSDAAQRPEAPQRARAEPPVRAAQPMARPAQIERPERPSFTPRPQALARPAPPVVAPMQARTPPIVHPVNLPARAAPAPERAQQQRPPPAQAARPPAPVVAAHQAPPAAGKPAEEDRKRKP